MTEPIWLDQDIVLDIHAELLGRFGGAEGIRDAGLLGSALARPLNRLACGDADLISLAVASAFGLVRNHPFINGNKRIAFAAVVVFLELNGLRFVASPAHATASVLALADGEIDESVFARWVRDHVTPIEA